MQKINLAILTQLVDSRDETDIFFNNQRIITIERIIDVFPHISLYLQNPLSALVLDLNQSFSSFVSFSSFFFFLHINMSDPSTRIKSHMNKDHQLSLNDYVIVYDSVDPKYLVEDSVHITDVDTNHLVIEYDLIKPNSATSITKTLALYWTDAEEAENIQVKSLSDIKGKLIAMAKYCAEKQGYAMTKITKIVGPSPLALSIYPSWLVLLLNAYNPNILKRLFANDALFNRIVKFLPSAVISAYQFTEINALKIAIGLFIVHFGEILFVSRPLLKKHRTPENVRVYWYLMHIIEGFFVILRLKKLT